MISNFKAIVATIINCVFSCMNLFWRGWESLTILRLVVFLYFIFFPPAIYKKIIIAISFRRPHPTKKQTEKETETESETESEPSGNRNPKQWPRPEQKQNRKLKRWPRPETETAKNRTRNSNRKRFGCGPPSLFILLYILFTIFKQMPCKSKILSSLQH